MLNCYSIAKWYSFRKQHIFLEEDNRQHVMLQFHLNHSKSLVFHHKSISIIEALFLIIVLQTITDNMRKTKMLYPRRPLFRGVKTLMSFLENQPTNTKMKFIKVESVFFYLLFFCTLTSI